MPRISDNGFNLDITRLRINLRADGGNPAIEFFIGICIGDSDNSLPEATREVPAAAGRNQRKSNRAPVA